MGDDAERDVRGLALATGATAAGSAVSLAVFYAVQGPFGTINDLGNATVGVLSAALAWRLRSTLAGQARTLAVVSAVLGAGVTVVGSYLVISATTGWFFAGLVSSVGFGGIGGWLLALTVGEQARRAWPRRVRTLGVAAGALMALGVLVAPGIPQGYDNVALAPGWLWIGFIAWLSIYVVYPAWAIAFALRRPSLAHRSAALASASGID